MKLKEGFILQKVAGENVAVPSGEDADLDLMITLNNVGAFLWTLLEQDRDEDALVKALMTEHEVDETRARQSVRHFMEKLKEENLVE